uniref:BACK domain-containing protein n=1 Tax=Tetranychus urticae TaxID=32264 RepID=T1JY86_TETUR
MVSLEADDQLTIVNRSMEHRISKKLIRKIPYFESMLSHDVLESKENKVILDLDEKTFKLILDGLDCDYSFIKMDNVINLCTMTDYLGMEWVSDECLKYFHDKFTIENLPVIIPQVTTTSKCINSGELNAFICRHFLKITNLYIDKGNRYWDRKIFWLEFPIETIEYICALDLMIYSEYQVFDSISYWIRKAIDSRKCYFERLLKLVRWCHLNEQDLSKIKENELFKSSGFEPIFCSPRKVNCDCTFNRTKQNYFFMIEELDGTDLRIKVLDHDFLQLVNRVIQLDDSITSRLLHDEHISDVVLDSGRQIIRIDWIQNKYRLFDPSDYYIEIFDRCIIEKSQDAEHYLRLSKTGNGCSFFDDNQKFSLISMEEGYLRWFLRPNPESFEKFDEHSFLVTVLNNDIYLLSSDLTFIKLKVFNSDKELKLDYRYKSLNKKWEFKNLILTSSQANDDRVILVDKASKDFICFNVNTSDWSSIGRLINCYSPEDSKKLFSFTSAFLSLNTIELA